MTHHGQSRDARPVIRASVRLVDVPPASSDGRADEAAYRPRPGVPAPATAPVGPVPRATPAPATRPEPARRATPVAARRGRPLRRVAFALFATLAAVSVAGLPYYVLDPAGRVRSPLHPWFKPSGIVGQSAGIVTLALFLFLWLYPIRKKFRWLAFTGPVGKWLDVHIVAGLAVPWLGAIHAAWHFEGLIGLGYGAMLLVSLSGVVGKFLYSHIPRSRNGIELSLEEIEARRGELIEDLGRATGLNAAEVLAALGPAKQVRLGLGILGTFFGLAGGDVAAYLAARRLRRSLTAHGRRVQPDRRALRQVVRLARREVSLGRQVRMLNATQRVFRYWHVAHRPVAITALVAVMTHVVVVIALGVTWFG